MRRTLRLQRDGGDFNRILRRPEVLERVGVSSTTFWRMRVTGRFPRGFRISPGLLGWLEADVDRWIEDRRGGPQRTSGSV